MNILLAGAAGAMGQVVAALIREQGKDRVVAGFDRTTQKHADFPVYTAMDDITVLADVLIDFSHPSALPAILKYAVKNNLPSVLAATGLDDTAHTLIKQASRQIPILQTGNLSLGISVLSALVRQTAAALPGFDIEIIEKHHNKKADAPSGTAAMLLEAARAGREDELIPVYGRFGQSARRQSGEVGIHAVRGGTIAGEHEVIFAGLDEVIEIRHRANSKRVFAAGALRAAAYVIQQPPGLYSAADLFC